MNKQKARRFLRVIDIKMNKIEEEAIKAFKESCLIEEENDIRISIDFQGNVEAEVVSPSTKFLEDDKEINIFTLNQAPTHLNDMFGELCYLNDYEEFENWCENEWENLNWDSYKKFNKENFEEITERNIDDSTPVFFRKITRRH